MREWVLFFCYCEFMCIPIYDMHICSQMPASVYSESCLSFYAHLQLFLIKAELPITCFGINLVNCRFCHAIYHSALAYQNGNEVVENVDVGPSTAVCLDGRGVERSGDNFRLNVPARSVPTSPFTSSAFSPQRTSLGDLLPYYCLTPRGNNMWSAPEMPTGLPSPSFLEHNGSPLLSPQTKNPHRTSKSLCGSASPMHHKSLVENSTAWRESNVQAGVHPLPRPPGAAFPSHSPPNAQVTVKTESLPLKSQWQKGRLIGRGTFGSVYVASNRYVSSGSFHVPLVLLLFCSSIIN